MKLSVNEEFLWDVYSVLQKTGDVAISLLSPSFSKYYLHVGNPVFDKYRHNKNKAKFAKLVYYAKKNNYIRVQNIQGKKGILLTKEGLGKILKASFKIDSKEKRKDGKWIMIVFDIPVANKKSRHLMTSVLNNLGYKMFQQSVWVTPYDVFEKTEEALQFYSLEKFVKTFLIEEV